MINYAFLSVETSLGNTETRGAKRGTRQEGSHVHAAPVTRARQDGASGQPRNLAAGNSFEGGSVPYGLLCYGLLREGTEAAQKSTGEVEEARMCVAGVRGWV